MRGKTEQDIVNYIEYLRSAGYVICLSCFNQNFLEKSIPRLKNYEPHLCDICFYLKNHPQTGEKCGKSKQHLLNSTKQEIIFDCCWAGVEEYIFPIIYFGQLICRIHITGYRGSLKNAKRRAGLLSKRLGEEFTEIYSLLSTDIPTEEHLSHLITPLQYMFEKLAEENLQDDYEPNSAAALYPKMLQYIYSHYLENIQVEDIAEALNYSTPYLASVFRKMNGNSIMEYVNMVRLDHGYNLLRFTRLPITRIAYECGFRDSNYFSTVFKKFSNMTPSQFRDRHTPAKKN